MSHINPSLPPHGSLNWDVSLNSALQQIVDKVNLLDDGQGSGGSVTSVAGRTGAVVLTASDVALGNVNNTSDANKPVSNLQQAAIDQAKNRANHIGTQSASTITGLSSVATSGLYSDLANRPSLGTAASQDSSAFDPAGAASAITLYSLGGITPSAVDTKISTKAVALPANGTTTGAIPTVQSNGTVAYQLNYVPLGTVAPNPTLFPIWVDVSAVPPVLKGWNGTSFVALTGFGSGGGNPISNTVAPVISGTTQVGQTVTVSNGTWNPTPDNYSYQWKRGSSNISGATSASYLLDSADLGLSITAVVTAIKSGYDSTPAPSAAIVPTSGGGSSSATVGSALVGSAVI